MTVRRWTRQEDATLQRLYRAGVPRQRIATALDRSTDALDARRRALGIPGRPRGKPWPPAEDALLRAADKAGLPAVEVDRRLGRPPGAVRWRRRLLGLQRRGAHAWTPTEDQLLHQRWAQGGDLAELASRLGRSPAALRLRAGTLGLTRPPRRRRRQPDDDRQLQASYAQRLTCAAIATRMDRTERAVAARARKLGLAAYARRWTRAEDAALVRLAGKGVALEQAACLLVRTPEALRLRPPPQRPVTHTRRAPQDAAAMDPCRGRAAHPPRRPGPGPAGVAAGPLGRGRAPPPGDPGRAPGGARSPHYRVASPQRLTPAQQRLRIREFRPDNGRVLLSLARRLGLLPRAVRQLALQLAAAGVTTAEPNAPWQQRLS